MAENFLDHHISSNGYLKNSERFMVCLDISPAIDLHAEVFNPITRNKKKILMHPIINTYIMMKYSSYAVIFIFYLIVKLIFAILLSSVAVADINRQNNSSLSATEISPMSEETDHKFWFFYIVALGTSLKHHSLVDTNHSPYLYFNFYPSSQL